MRRLHLQMSHSQQRPQFQSQMQNLMQTQMQQSMHWTQPKPTAAVAAPEATAADATAAVAAPDAAVAAPEAALVTAPEGTAAVAAPKATAITTAPEATAARPAPEATATQAVTLGAETTTVPVPKATQPTPVPPCLLAVAPSEPAVQATPASAAAANDILAALGLGGPLQDVMAGLAAAPAGALAPAAHETTDQGQRTLQPGEVINTSTNRAAAMRLRRLMENTTEAARFPHMQKLWQGSRDEACSVFRAALVFEVF